VVLADEPTGNLDPVNTADIVNLLLKVNGLGTTVILATHDSKVVNDLGRRVIAFDGGRMVSDQENGTYLADFSGTKK
jgi:cell division transport system ATP-binding protein